MASYDEYGNPVEDELDAQIAAESKRRKLMDLQAQNRERAAALKIDEDPVVAYNRAQAQHSAELVRSQPGNMGLTYGEQDQARLAGGGSTTGMNNMMKQMAAERQAQGNLIANRDLAAALGQQQQQTQRFVAEKAMEGEQAKGLQEAALLSVKTTAAENAQTARTAAALALQNLKGQQATGLQTLKGQQATGLQEQKGNQAADRQNKSIGSREKIADKKLSADQRLARLSALQRTYNAAKAAAAQMPTKENNDAAQKALDDFNAELAKLNAMDGGGAQGGTGAAAAQGGRKGDALDQFMPQQ